MIDALKPGDEVLLCRYCGGTRRDHTLIKILDGEDNGAAGILCPTATFMQGPAPLLDMEPEGNA